ncbi:MAG TPA: lipid-A-disaccharide synthase [Sphingobacteriaceae bacterium]
MKFYLLAGEASGDLHGANLIRALKSADPEADFRYFGGDKMAAEGGSLSKHISELAFMGFVEVLVNLRTIFKNMSFARQDILDYKPDALILIDFPGFNLKIAEFAKKNGIRVFYYISPKVWAWNQKRVLKIRKVVDHMFCILPFEVGFYRDWGMDVDYIGNPLMDAIEAHAPDPKFLQNNQLSSRPIVALLPGSRKQEVERMLPVMVRTAALFPGYQFVVAGAPNFEAAYYQRFLNGQDFPVVFHATYDLLKHSRAAIVASGTATLETALLNTPQVVVYKAAPISIAIARLVVKIRFISLVNLIMDREVVKELIQSECNSETIAKELNRLLPEVPDRRKMLNDYRELAERVGPAGASGRAAHLIMGYLGR